MTQAEFDHHRLDHTLMFCDKERHIECSCGVTISYELSYELGFESTEDRMGQEKADVWKWLTSENPD